MNQAARFHETLPASGHPSKSSSAVPCDGRLTYRLTALIALMLLYIVYEYRPGFSLCPFHYLFGLPCPFCGLTRSMGACLHLDFASAWALHPFGPAVLAYIAGAAATNRPDWPLTWLSRRIVSASSGRIKTAVLVAFGIFWVVRLVHLLQTQGG